MFALGDLRFELGLSSLGAAVLGCELFSVLLVVVGLVFASFGGFELLWVYASRFYSVASIWGFV